MDYRYYQPERDKSAAHRMLKEAGWTEEGKEEVNDLIMEAGRGLVIDLRGEPECMVITAPGAINYLEVDLPLSAVTGVITSYIARKQGLATQLTAHALAEEAAEGALVAGLGMFDQGFYNRLGFGTGSYEHLASFDPSTLLVGTKARVPHRITVEDWEAVHASRWRRRRYHGACSLKPTALTQAEMKFSEGFGLGYYDDRGKLTHHFWGKAKDEHGPYSIWWVAYQTPEQFRELMALLKNLSDQVYLIRMKEPPDIRLQDMLSQPFKVRQMTEKAKFESRMRAWAYWQARILDLAGCLAQTHLPGKEVRFNLKLHDPIAHYLAESDAPWQGISGEYVVTLGPSSSAEPGAAQDLPTLSASVGAFTRLWLGIAPASSLVITDELVGPTALLKKLDWLLRLPQPSLDWDF